LKGDMGQVRDIALLIQGAPNMYADRGPTASINFITAHDGFTLADLFSYNEKHNRANGEENRDGHSHNYSWNCGHEGASDDLEIQTLRRRLMKNGMAILLVSQGVPMILMGDEVAHTKQGNNNTYCQDNELSWFDWSQLESEADMFTFVKHCISFRKQHRVLRNRFYFQQRDAINSGYPDISWHGAQAWKPDWSDNSRTLSFMLCGEHVPAGKEPDNYIYVAMNMHWENHTLQLPRLPKERQWHLFMDTSLPSGNEICEPGQERLLSDQNQVLSGARSVIILVGR
ncbi:MAG: glycogen debranching enzyme, partial [Anaerolineaceae bacterium]